MPRAVSRRAALFALLIASALATPSGSAFAQGTTRFSYDGKMFKFVGTDLSGNTFQVTFPGNPGDFLRRNPDGTSSIHAESDAALVTVTPANLPVPVFVGQTSFNFSASVVVLYIDSQGNPFWQTDGERINLSGKGQLTNLFDGSTWGLSVQIVQRDQQYKVYEVDLFPR